MHTANLPKHREIWLEQSIGTEKSTLDGGDIVRYILPVFPPVSPAIRNCWFCFISLLLLLLLLLFFSPIHCQFTESIDSKLNSELKCVPKRQRANEYGYECEYIHIYECCVDDAAEKTVFLSCYSHCYRRPGLIFV